MVNAASTQWLADYARSAHVSRFVYASSGSVYQPRARPLTEDAPVRPPTYHPATKRMSEMMLTYYEPYFSLAVLRLFAPYGPGQVNRLIPRMIESVRNGTPVSLSRGGEPRINPIFVDDLVAVLAQALAGNRTYTVNLAGPRTVSMRSLAQLIGAAVGRKPIFVEAESATKGNLVADTRRMHDLFAVATMVEPKDGIARVVSTDFRGRV